MIKLPGVLREEGLTGLWRIVVKWLAHLVLCDQRGEGFPERIIRIGVANLIAAEAPVETRDSWEGQASL